MFRPFARMTAGVLLLVSVALPAHAADACASPRYNVAPTVAAGSTPVAVAVGDFNRDGLRDLAVANGGAGSVSILLGAGAGGFSPARNFPVGGGPESLVVADFNGDGASDLAVSRNADLVSILLGNGDGTFAAPSVLNGGGIGPTSLSAGDFNGDARSDLALTNANTDDVSIFLGTGAGTFNGPVRFNAGDQPTHSAVGDFNNDGKSDLAIAGGNVRVLLGNGDGTFGAPAGFDTGGPAHTVAVADFNGDGKSDLAVGVVFFGNRISVLLGTGTGSFSGPINLLTGKDPRTVAAGDFNGDGKADIVAANREADNVSILLGDGAGGFARAVNYATGGGPVGVAVADFDGDGNADLATANVFSNDVSILRGAGGGRFAAPDSLGFLNPSNTQDERSGPGPVVRGDFNGDGRNDVATANFFSDDISVLLGTESGSLSERMNFHAGNRLSDMVAGDFNADGRSDLAAVTNDPDGVAVLLATEAGGLSAPLHLNAGPRPNRLAAGDFNGDGNTDLAVTNSSNPASVSLLLGTGTGSFHGPVSFAVASGPGEVAVGDFNGDGKRDLAVTHFFAQSISILLGDGAGGFAAGTSVPVGDTSVSVAVGDFNGDGKSDLAAVVGFSIADSLVIFTGSGGGTFTRHATIALGFSPLSVVAGDFNGDSAADLAVTINRRNRVSLIIGDGAGGFAGPFDFYAGASPTDLVDGDFNADGKSDLVVTNNEADTVTVLLGVAAQPSATTQFCAAAYHLNEGGRSVRLNVSRGGDVSGPARVGYLTSNATASDRSDYTAAAGTLRFAAGETTKSITVLITDDALSEGAETFTVRLVNPEGLTLGAPSTAAVTINDNDGASRPSPVSDQGFDVQFFVRQHYLDFLNREPDADGLAFWSNEINSCGADAQCREVKRVNVSAAFFLSIEFQETGYLAYRMYKSAYGDATSPNVPGTVPVIRLGEFIPDAQRLGEGVQVGVGDWQARLEANKNDFALEFVSRARFLSAFPLTMTPAQFVDKLDQNAGGVLTPAEREGLIARLAGAASATQARASVLRSVAEHAELRRRELNRAFVLMQYFGYLRRNPDDPQDTDFRGWRFWLDKLEQFNGNFVEAEMVKAFIQSIEYGHRFGL